MSGPMHRDDDPACDCLDCEIDHGEPYDTRGLLGLLREVEEAESPADPIARVQRYLSRGVTFIEGADVVHVVAALSRAEDEARAMADEIARLRAENDRLIGYETTRALCCHGNERLVVFADVMLAAIDQANRGGGEPAYLIEAANAYRTACAEERAARGPLP